MDAENVYMALYKEDQVDMAADGIAFLKSVGITDRDISVISGVPYSDKMLGRPMSWTRVPLIAISGAVVGFILAMLLNIATVMQYPIQVGGQALFAIPTSIVVAFEITMLGLLISTFLGVVLEMMSPSFGPKTYHPGVTDGEICVMFGCPGECEQKVFEGLRMMGASVMHSSEVKSA
jgi:hypothetical protein